VIWRLLHVGAQRIRRLLHGLRVEAGRAGGARFERQRAVEMAAGRVLDAIGMMHGRDGAVGNNTWCARTWRRCGRWSGGSFCHVVLRPVQIRGGPALFKQAGPRFHSAPGRTAEVGRPVAFSQYSHNFPIIQMFQL
jgi:hypothetical protein